MTSGDDITRTGPRGYELQYDITAWLGFEAPSGSKLFVETDDGEDAELSIEGDARLERVDLQVKGASGDFDVDALVEVLTHFPKRDGSACLLERLAKQPKRLLVIGAATRASDATAPLRSVGATLRAHESATRGIKQAAAAVRTALAAMAKPKKDDSLDHTRWIAIQRFVAGTNEATIASLLLRVRLIENATRLTMQQQLVECMIREGVARSEAQYSLPALSELVVRVSRDRRDDLLPRLREFVRVRRAGRAGPHDSGVEPPRRAALRDDLERRHVVLLTGDSQSGKTFTAGLLCQELQDRGWDFVLAGAVDEASRFLMRDDTTDSVMLLEDPFGHDVLPDDARNAWSSFERLLRRARRNRRLIVTSTSARIRELVRRDPPWTSAGHPWIDLTTDDRAYLRAVWQHVAVSLEADVRNAVDAHLAKCAPRELWQPGHLQRIAQPLSEHPAGESVDLAALDRIARQEAHAIAQAFIDDGDAVVRMVETLGLTATTIDEVFLEELTFVLEGGSARPGAVPEGRHPPGLMLGGKQEPISWPTYPDLELSREHFEALAKLERLGIVVVRGNARVFAHPDYVLAARHLLEDPTAARAADVGARLERTLCCLRPATARVGARLFRELAARQSTLPAILQSARIGLRSLFPAVRDLAAGAFLSIASFRVDEELLHHVLSHEGWDHAMRWREGEAWYSPEETVGPDFDEIYPSRELVGRAQSALEELQRGRRLTPEQVRGVLLAAGRGVEFDEELARRFLTYDEALLRAWTAERLLASGRAISNDVLEQLLHDPSPRVWFATVTALLASWNDQPTSTRSAALAILDGMKLDPLRVHLATRMLLRLPDDVTSEGRLSKDAWPFWATLIVRMLSELPGGRFELDRIPFHLDEAELEVDAKIDIIDHWAAALSRRRYSEVGLSDGLGVARSLLTLTESDGGKRADRLTQWLSAEDTAFVATTVRDMVEAWSSLRDDERSALLQAVHANRSDSEWLAAVSLTTSVRPTDLLSSFGYSMTTPSEVVDTFPPAFLTSCLSVAFGRSSIFDAFNLSLRDSAFWDRVAVEVLARPGHVARSIALWRLLSEREPTRLATWTTLTASADPAECSVLLELLVESSVDHSGKELRPFWDAWFASPNAEVQAAHEKLVAAAPEIDRFHQLRATIGDGPWEHVVLAHTPDTVMLLALGSYTRVELAPEAFVAFSTAIFSRDAPVLPAIHGFVRDVVRDWKDPASVALLDLINTVADAQRDAREAKKAAEPLPDGWLWHPPSDRP